MFKIFKFKFNLSLIDCHAILRLQHSCELRRRTGRRRISVRRRPRQKTREPTTEQTKTFGINVDRVLTDIFLHYIYPWTKYL
jgi:hypothetical protein